MKLTEHPDEELPPRLGLELDETVLDLWRARGVHSQEDTYAGVPLVKFPEDLRVYEHLLWMSSPSVVIELGIQAGGSALWFRDRLRALAAYGRVSRVHVIGVDIDTDAAHANLAAVDPAYSETITLLTGDVRDPALAQTVAGLVAPEDRVLVVEDSAHDYEATSAALRHYAGLVPVGGWFVVEDGGVDVDVVRLDPAWPRGVIPAIHDWLASEEGAAFVMRRDLELYGVTSNPEGYLQRVR